MYNTKGEYLAIIDAFSQYAKGEKYVFYGVDWWPLIRIRVAYQLHLLMINKKPTSSSFKHNKLNLNQPKLRYVDGLLKLKEKLFHERKRNGIAVITSSSHKTFQISSGEFINPFTDPFLYYFKQLNIKYDVIDVVNWKNNNPDLLFLRQYYYSRVVREFNSDHLIQKKLLDINEFFKKNVGSLFSVYDSLAYGIVNSQATYFTYYDYFKRNNYEKVLYFCYYMNHVMAINRAAKELGLITIEYQHSQISSNHFAYSGWDNRIKNSDCFFPSVFWAWRDGDLITINNCFSFLPSFKAIKGGNVFLSFYKKPTRKIEYEKIKVLVTLQGIGLPEFLQEYIRSNKNIFWYLRLHPRYPSDKSLIENLHYTNADNTDIEEANKRSLYELLSEVNYHMTCFSGSALEAQSFGVQNIIFGEDGYISYQDNIKNKSFFYVNSKEEIDQIFINRLKSESLFNVVLTEEGQIMKTITSLFSETPKD